MKRNVSQSKYGYAVAALLLAGCSNGYSEKKFPVLPDELKDCRFFYITNDKGESLTVVRCPISVTTTAYRQGKSTRTSVVIDGAEYEPKGATK